MEWYANMLKFFCWKNMSSFCSAKATHIFSAKNIRILYIESAKTVNEMTLNELVKLTTLWTTGPSILMYFLSSKWTPKTDWRSISQALKRLEWQVKISAGSIFKYMYMYISYFFQKTGFAISCKLRKIEKISRCCLLNLPRAHIRSMS